jgi:hypothetical protein
MEVTLFIETAESACEMMLPGAALAVPAAQRTTAKRIVFMASPR